MADDAPRQEVARFAPPRIPYHPAVQERFGIDQAGWRALIDAVWPGARTSEAVVLALSYCKARKLDPFKRPVHIVGVWSREQKRVVESCWPGIGELRTTAFRTGLYAGREATEWGPDREMNFEGGSVTYPEWAQVTVHRLDKNGQPRPYPGPRVYWVEAYATRAHDTVAPNEMWRRRVRGQLDKVAEAAALRAAFPEELGNDYAAEEMEGQVIDHAPEPASNPPLRGNEALRSRLQTHDPASGSDNTPGPPEPPAAATPIAPPEEPRRRRKSAAVPAEAVRGILKDSEPTEAAVERSQARIAMALGPEEIAALDQATPVFVPYNASVDDIQGWLSRARERVLDMQRAEMTPDRYAGFRKANFGPLLRLRTEHFSDWQQLDALIATGESR